MATKTLPVVLICCAAAASAVIGWQVGDDLFAEHEPASEQNTDAPGYVSVLKSLPSANRDVKRDRADLQPLPDTPPQLRMSLADNPDTRAEFSPMPSRIMPPPMVPRPMGKTDKSSRAYLNDAQLAAIKQRLRLTKAQDKYWQPVEVALRGLTQQVAEFQNRVKRREYSFDIESPEIQQLKAVGKPFLAQLRDDQKAQVQMLVTMAGLGPMMASLTAEKEDGKGEN